MLNKLNYAYTWEYLGVLLTTLVMAGALYYFQLYLMLDPCPLCIGQRLFFILVALLFAMNMFITPASYFTASLPPVAALGGMTLAGRHIYLQNLPKDQLPECLPGIDYMMEIFPFIDVLTAVFIGSGDCGDTLWSFLSLTIPEWSALMFGLLFLIAARAFFLKSKSLTL